MPRSPEALVLLLVASVASADEIVLNNGGKLLGRATRVGDEVVVTTPHGATRLPAADVRSITPGRTVWDDYADKAKAVDAKDGAAQLALGDWCREKGLSSEATRHWRRVVEIDPDHAQARARLGFVRHDERWLTLDEYRAARGFVQVDGEWISREEARRRDAARLSRATIQTHVRTIRDCVVRMQSMKRKKRNAARLDLQRYAESMGDLRLAAFAGEVAEFYNSSWRTVREALVRVEVRATMATLKRPIPTITTSLGANSTPVTIQLPEVSIVSIRTTALVPADIELDEDP
jgi:hypothetical protein